MQRATRQWLLDELRQASTPVDAAMVLRLLEVYSSPQVLVVVQAAKQFRESVTELQTMAGHTQEEWSEISQGLLDMAESKENDG